MVDPAAALANRVFEREAWAQQRLAEHAGRVFVVRVGPAAAALALTTAGVVAQAHARSQSFGLQPHEQADLHLLDRQTLAWTVARNEALCAHAPPSWKPWRSSCAARRAW